MSWNSWRETSSVLKLIWNLSSLWFRSCGSSAVRPVAGLLGWVLGLLDQREMM